MQILAGLIIYYSIIIFIFATGSEYFTGITSNIELNATSISDAEVTGGWFDLLPDITRFVGFVFMGIIPDNTINETLQFFLIVWQTGITLFTLGWIISIFWDG